MAYGVTEGEEARSSGRSTVIFQTCGVYPLIIDVARRGRSCKMYQRSTLNCSKLQHPDICPLTLAQWPILGRDMEQATLIIFIKRA